jgi:hypothetical protein
VRVRGGAAAASDACIAARACRLAEYVPASRLAAAAQHSRGGHTEAGPCCAQAGDTGCGIGAGSAHAWGAPAAAFLPARYLPRAAGSLWPAADPDTDRLLTGPPDSRQLIQILILLLRRPAGGVCRLL